MLIQVIADDDHRIAASLLKPETHNLIALLRFEQVYGLPGLHRDEVDNVRRHDRDSVTVRQEPGVQIVAAGVDGEPGDLLQPAVREREAASRVPVVQILEEQVFP